MDQKRPKSGLRTVFSKGQLLRLDEEFSKSPYASAARRDELAAELSLPQITIKTWFQNRRMKEKRDQTLRTWPPAVPNLSYAGNMNKSLVNNEPPTYFASYSNDHFVSYTNAALSRFAAGNPFWCLPQIYQTVPLCASEATTHNDLYANVVCSSNGLNTMLYTPTSDNGVCAEVGQSPMD